MDFDQAVAPGDKINGAANSHDGASGLAPRQSLGDIARALRWRHAAVAPQTTCSPKAVAQPSKTVARKIVVNQDDRGQLQICGADSTACRGLK